MSLPADSTIAALPDPLPPLTGQRRLGEVLVESGAVDAEKLERALLLQKMRGGRLGEVLLAEGMVQPLDLVRALASQFGLEFLDLDGVDIDRSLAEVVPEPLARRHRALPVKVDDDGTVVVAMVNPADIVALDDIRSLLRRRARSVMVDAGQLGDAISRSSAGDEQVQAAIRSAVADAPEQLDAEQFVRSVGTGTGDAPIIRFVDLMLSKAMQERASDIHVEPNSVGLRVRYRIDGVLHEAMHPPRSLHAGIISRIKVLAAMDIAEKRLPQDGRFSFQVGDRQADLRVATVPTVFGESAVLRILRRDDGLGRVADLGMRPDQFERFESAFHRRWGLVLVTGPTGSGKTTTLYSVLRELNDPSRNLLTVEDPVEYRLDGIKQVQVQSKIGLTFAAALRSMLRADPDVVLVGEIRDMETAVTAVEASLTGHLVLASIHTNDAASTPLRLLEMGVEPYLVVAGLRGVLAQRLARRLCDRCREPLVLGRADAVAAGVPESMLGPDGSFATWRSVGCEACQGTGYRGRFAVCEYLDVSEQVAHLVLERAPSQQVLRLAREEGMLAMREAGLLHVRDGTTSLEELYRALG